MTQLCFTSSGSGKNFGRLVLLLALLVVMSSKASAIRSPIGTLTGTWRLDSRLNTTTVTPRVALQQAHTYYVAIDGDDDNPGTEAQPFRTITNGVSVLGPGDTLYVKSGTFMESLRDFPSGTSWDAPVTIAAYPGDLVTIKAPSGPWVIRFTHCHHVVLDGFIIDGANVDHNGIKVSEGAHHIRIKNSEVKGASDTGVMTALGANNNEFIHLDVHENGTTEYDHGFYIMTSNNLVEDCTIHDNAGNGVQVYDSSGSIPDDNVIRRNKIYDNGTAGLRSRGIIFSTGSGNLAYNNLIWGNKIGIQTFTGTNHRIYNNTIYDNAQYGLHLEAPATARNNIVYLNQTDLGTVDGSTMDHNLVGTDPQFINASAYDFHLQPTSPAIDAGIALGQVPDDFDGVSRPRGSGYDIGAYEYPFSARVTDLRVVAAVGDTPTLTVTLRWTAPVAAITYTLRSSNTLLTAANWDHAPVVTVPFTASEPGSSEWLTTPVDYTGGTLYLALKSQTSAGIWSELSNNAFWPYLNIYLPLITKDYGTSLRF